MHRLYALSAHLRQRFGGRILKIPLDAGFSCPNRDGTLSSRGCIFCNPAGSGSGMGGRGLDILAQWAFWRDLHRTRHGIDRFTAYLQSFSNTHGPVDRLAAVLDELAGLPGLAALSIGTRPDCLDDDKLDLLAERRDALGLADLTLELGLQSAHDATLAHINRGHDAAAFAEAAQAAHARGLTVVAHVIAGLPRPGGREGRDELAATRQREQREAAAAVGVDDVRFLGQPDGHLEANLELRKVISRVVRQVRPDLVLCQAPVRRWDRIYASHPDHLAVAEATMCAVYPDARNPHAHVELLAEGFEPHAVAQTWVVGLPRPDHFVDITDVFDRKVKALSSHASQVAWIDDVDAFLRGWATDVSAAHGLPEGTLTEAWTKIDTL